MTPLFQGTRCGVCVLHRMSLGSSERDCSRSSFVMDTLKIAVLVLQWMWREGHPARSPSMWSSMLASPHVVLTVHREQQDVSTGISPLQPLEAWVITMHSHAISFHQGCRLPLLG